jgi:PKD repeat protein
MRALKRTAIFVSLLLFSLSVQAQGQSGHVEITGEAAVEIADFFEEGRSELYYFIVDKQSRARTQVFFPGLPDAAFMSGAKVRIRGKSRGKGKGIDVEAVEVVEPAPGRPRATAPIDGPTAEAPVASDQTRKVLTLVVDFLDAVVDTGTGNAVTPLIVSNQMFHDTQNIQHFYNKASLGTLAIPSDPNTIGKEAIFGPYTINYNYLTTSPGGASCDANGWANAALTAWEADTVNNTARETRSDYDSWSIIVPNYYDYSGRACGWGGYAGVGCTQCWAFSADPASILFGVIIHELGHNFGFGHANSDTDNDGLNICGYCDRSDLMGGDREWMKFNAPHFDFQGWWDPVNYDIDTIAPSSTQLEFDLIPVDEEDTLWPGLRAVKTPRTTGSNYYFSYRRQTGHYNNVNTPYTTGVNIHWGSSSFSSGYTTNFYRMLEAGQVFEDPGQDLFVWGVGSILVDDGLGNTTNVFTIRVCNSTCSTLWPPLNLTAVGRHPDTIRLIWEDYTYNEDGWRIDYSTDGSSWSELTTVAADSTFYDHTGLTGGTTLYYRVQAYRGSSETSEWTNTVSATTPPASGSDGFPIISGDDDTLEYTGPFTGQMYPNWDYLWLGYDSGNNATTDEGLRFQNISIPQGATINSAYIKYYAYSSGSGDTSIRFRTENVDNAAAFSTASANLTSRTFGSTFVDWTLPTSWASGSLHQSPDLSSIVQPIVDREDWGGGNSMVFITQGNPANPSGTHRVRTYNYGSTWAPVLEVDFTWTPPGPVAPTASFNYSTYSLNATFTDTSTDSDGSVVGWLWDFGDSSTSTLQNPVHTYASSGTYTVGLTVIDNDGETGNTSQSVTITADTEDPVITILGSNPALVDQFEPYTEAGATASDNLDGDLTSSISTTGLPVDTDTPGDVTVNYSVSDGSGNVGSADRTVTVVANQAPSAGFSASSALLQMTFTDTSTDTDGTVESWSWDFGDGNSSTSQNPVHNYSSYNTYTVNLTVTDDDGASDIHTTNVTVAPDLIAPVITLLGANPDSVGQYDSYSEPGYTATDDVDGELSGSVAVGGWDYDTGIAGVKTLTYNVSDASGNPAVQRTRTVTVMANQNPVAAFLYSANGLSVDFTDDSGDADGNVVAWSWDFGDSGSSTAQNPTHVYAGDGSFTVTLTVTDDDGQAGQTSESITLLAAPDGLVATPTAIDSIDLSWNDNSTFETGYIIERSSGGAGAWAQIASVGASVNAFTDSADLSNGSVYDYRVKATGTDFDSAYSNTASVTTFVCSSSKTFTGGEWYQFALACDPGPYNTVAHIFDGPQPLVYGFDNASNTYARLASNDILVPGTGYWINFIHTTAYTLSGYDTVNADISLASDPVNGRNNLVGFYGNDTVAWPDVLVVDGMQTNTLLEADPWENGANPTNRVCDLPTPTNKCLMSRKLNIWGGSKAAGSYQVHDPDVPGQEGMLVPLDGLWVKAFKSGVKLRIPAPTAPAPEAAAAPLSSPDAAADSKKNAGKGQGKGKKDKSATWYVRLVAESGKLRDPGNTLGQKAGSIQGQDARDLEEPAPFGGPHLSILFTNPLFDASSWGFTTDFRAPADSPLGEWPFVVRASSSLAPITLSWEADAFDFAGTWLIDQRTGERIAVTAGGSYTFQPAGPESSFVFVIE